MANNPSLESCDPPLKVKPTLPSMELPTVKGTLSKMVEIINLDLRGDTDQSARPLARFQACAN